MKILIKNASYVVRDVNRIEKNVDILINGNKISKVGEFSHTWLNEDEIKIINASGKAVIPGLINTHTHLYQHLLKGHQDNLSLVKWCEKVTFPLIELILKEQSEGEAEIFGYYWSLLASIEMLKNGVTTFINLGLTLNSVFKAWEDIGIRGIGAITYADMWIPDKLKLKKRQFKEKTLRFINRWHLTPLSNPHIYIMLGPSAPFLCSEDLLLWIRKQATQKKIKIHTHLSETQYEVELMQKERGCRPVEYLENIGFLGSDITAVHCIHLNEKELGIIKKFKVIPIHCPKSNMKLASGIAPVNKMISMGIDVALGTDGSASNDNQDIFEEMRTASFLQKVASNSATAISAKDVFKMATEGGALACGINAGTIDEGKLADIALINLNHPHLLPLGDLINMIVYCVRGSDVETVLVNGQIVIRNGRLITLPEKEIIKEAKKIIESKLNNTGIIINN